jgi:hypothetical protein
MTRKKTGRHFDTTGNHYAIPNYRWKDSVNRQVVVKTGFQYYDYEPFPPKEVLYIGSHTIKEGMDFECLKCRVITKRGKRIRQNRQKYFVHVLKTKSIRVMGDSVDLKGRYAFFAFWSHKKRLYGKPDSTDTIKVRALFLKGVMKYPDSLAKNLQPLLAELEKEAKQADSIYQAELKNLEPLKQAAQNDSAAAIEYEQKVRQLAMMQKAAQKPLEDARVIEKSIKTFGIGYNWRKMRRLFFSHYFRRTLKYMIRSSPWSLPEAVQDSGFKPSLFRKLKWILIPVRLDKEERLEEQQKRKAIRDSIKAEKARQDSIKKAEMDTIRAREARQEQMRKDSIEQIRRQAKIRPERIPPHKRLITNNPNVIDSSKMTQADWRKLKKQQEKQLRDSLKKEKKSNRTPPADSLATPKNNNNPDKAPPSNKPETTPSPIPKKPPTDTPDEQKPKGKRKEKKKKSTD